MIFSPMMFRVSCAVVAWLVGIAYCVVLALVSQVQCEGPGSNPFMAATLFAVPLVALLLISTRALRYRHALRWITTPFVLLVPLAVLGAWPYLQADGIEAIARCGAAAGVSLADAARPWHRYWAIGQVAVLVLLMVQVLRFWVGGTAGEAAG